tara:strand:- start:1347 stop:1985 length:639 start_codon:yes stop_codon:yes gene_type:complete
MKTIRNSLFFLIFFSFSSLAQENDFQIWNTLKLKKKINKSFTTDLKYGLRYRENASLISNQFIDLRVKYRENKRWSYAIGYRSISDYSISSNIQQKGRLYLDAYYSKKIKRYFIDLRSRLLTQGNSYSSKEVFRQKFKLSYNIRKTKLEPSLAIELFYNFDNSFYKVRNSLELAHPINKKLDFSLVYKIEHEFNMNDPMTLFIFEPKISYRF